MTNRLDRDFHLPGLLRFALPTIIMMLVVSLYTIVDGVLIARLVGENALAAANVAYPAISFTLAMGIMLGTGGSAVVAHKMGAGYLEEARRDFGFLALVAVCIGLAVCLAGALFAGPLARLLGALLGPLGLTEEWAGRLLTGLVEISSGVWTLTGEGTLSGRLAMAAFLLGWAGLSVHCQVLSFLGDSGLSPRTYLAGKLLHGGLSALFVAGLTRLIPLEAPVSDYLAQQVADIASAEFSTTLVLSVVSAWLVFLLFFLAAAASRKNLGKAGRGVL